MTSYRVEFRRIATFAESAIIEAGSIDEVADIAEARLDAEEIQWGPEAVDEDVEIIIEKNEEAE